MSSPPPRRRSSTASGRLVFRSPAAFAAGVRESSRLSSTASLQQDACQIPSPRRRPRRNRRRAARPRPPGAIFRGGDPRGEAGDFAGFRRWTGGATTGSKVGGGGSGDAAMRSKMPRRPLDPLIEWRRKNFDFIDYFIDHGAGGPPCAPGSGRRSVPARRLGRRRCRGKRGVLGRRGGADARTAGGGVETAAFRHAPC